ncbi:acyltransferase family protein [Marinicella litoralis]|uniref:Glucan biosynthesis protein C n=1 Tax=Marinicella litoralis TaxID=644220 RepID=A0A4R6XUA6_9GAMM|nr:acyltransferase family protein [Marinicella litoralis]TDR23572.1 glucan biosynthesis protein C [Marinicella litoralis]
MNVDSNQKRYHYMDNLRALAMLAGVVFHASLAYSPMLHFFWLSADKQSAASIDVMAWFSHLFRMPLFFLIAGFFAMLLIEKRGVLAMVGNRAMRVLVPLTIFLPLVLLSIGAGINWAGTHVENPSPALAFIYQMMQSKTGGTQPINLAHLWFLYYLCFMYVILVLLNQIKFFHVQWLQRVLKPWVLMVVFPLLLVPVFYSIPAPHPAPEGLMPLLWPFGFYGLFFLVGALLFKQQTLIDQLDKYFYPLLGAGLSSYVYFVYRMPAADGNLLMAIAESITAVAMTWVCMIAGKRWLNQPSKSFRYIADSSYWIYLIHMPVLFMIQYVLLDQDWNLWFELALSVLVTMIIGLLTYALFVRWSPIGWLLNGKR